MDAAFVASRLGEDLSVLLEEKDFEGAEELLSGFLGSSSELAPFIHYQFGRLYVRWNKLSSAIHHLNSAVEAAQVRGDHLFLIQILEELNLAKKFQQTQRP